ncbi:MAG: four helix bundle protein [Gemmatimonadaceae bacterium]|nr:four helix bundle protein [Gemmatimonadaceae bacterium]
MGVGRDETSDPLWNLLAYRVARCLVDHVQGDAVLLARRVDATTVAQLTRAIASIGANIAEGYSRRSGADRSRFYGFALGSAREAMLWYRSVAWALDADTVTLRMAFLAQERRLLLGMLKAVQRHGGPTFERGL